LGAVSPVWAARPGCGTDFEPHRSRTTMASDKRVKVTLECTECKRRNYITKKNKVNDRERIELSKYCRFDHKHTLHKETR
jgi:large subunit ribosomal protein L33